MHVLRNLLLTYDHDFLKETVMVIWWYEDYSVLGENKSHTIKLVLDCIPLVVRM